MGAGASIRISAQGCQLSNGQNPQPPEERDLLDSAMELPLIGAGVSRLQRVLGPSCLASLIVLLLLTVLFRRWVHLPPIGMLILLLIIWWFILGVMVRFRNSDPDTGESSGEIIERK
jgi:hypothetical protein